MTIQWGYDGGLKYTTLVFDDIIITCYDYVSSGEIRYYLGNSRKYGLRASSCLFSLNNKQPEEITKEQVVLDIFSQLDIGK